jgi:uncharacterized protein YllA (UPF0747 family)
MNDEIEHKDELLDEMERNINKEPSYTDRSTVG